MLTESPPQEREILGPPPGPVPGRVILAVALLGVVIMGITAQAAAFVESLKPEVWQGVAVLEYRGGELFTETVAVSVGSPTVWHPVAEKYGITIKDFEEHFTAKAVDGTQDISVEFLDEDPELAKGVVRDVVASYLELFAIPDHTEQVGLLDTYLEALRAVESDLVTLLADREVMTRNEQIDRQNELVAVRQQITNVLLRLDDQGLQTRAITDDLPRLVVFPYVLDEAVEPIPMKMAVFGAGAGGLLAAAMAFVVFFRRAEPVKGALLS